MDADEQAMLDEFLRMTGGGSFKARTSHRKGRGGKTRTTKAGRGRGRSMEQQLGEAFFMQAMAGGLEVEFEAKCPAGHVLKRKKAEGGYECDVCNHDISDGRRFYDCRKCDFSMCTKCYKAAEEKAALEEDEDEDVEGEIFEAFCEMNIKAERQGGRLRFRCQLCKKTFTSEEEAAIHMADAHTEELEAVAAEVKAEAGFDSLFGGMPPGMAGMMGGMPPGISPEELLMAAAMQDMMGGGMGGYADAMPGLGSSSGSRGGKRGSRRKK